MLIIYDLTTYEIISISGLRNFYICLVDIKPADPLPEGQAYFVLHDPKKIDKAWKLWDEGQPLEVVFDDEGNPVDVKCTGQE
jgi:hypothetical protein